jgi:hypothetical protein
MARTGQGGGKDEDAGRDDAAKTLNRSHDRPAFLSPRLNRSLL